MLGISRLPQEPTVEADAAAVPSLRVCVNYPSQISRGVVPIGIKKAMIAPIHHYPKGWLIRCPAKKHGLQFIS